MKMGVPVKPLPANWSGVTPNSSVEILPRVALFLMRTFSRFFLPTPSSRGARPGAPIGQGEHLGNTNITTIGRITTT